MVFSCCSVCREGVCRMETLMNLSSQIYPSLCWRSSVKLHVLTRFVLQRWQFPMDQSKETSVIHHEFGILLEARMSSHEVFPNTRDGVWRHSDNECFLKLFLNNWFPFQVSELCVIPPTFSNILWEHPSLLKVLFFTWNSDSFSDTFLGSRDSFCPSTQTWNLLSINVSPPGKH